MIRPLLLLLFIFSTFFCNAQKKKTDTTLRMLTYGMPDLNEDRLVNEIAQKFGFSYYAVAGCSVTKELKDSVRQENERVSKILDQRLGSNWKKTFDKEVDSMLNLHAQVKALIKKGLNKAGNPLYYIIYTDDRPNIFNIDALGWDSINGVSTSGIYSLPLIWQRIP